MSTDACAECGELLSPYLDSELEPEATFRLEAHLDTCAACREELAALEALQASLHEDPPYFTPPPGFEDRIFAAVRQAAEPPPANVVPFGRRARRWALPVVSFAALAASLLLFLTPQTSTGVSLGDEAISAHIRATLGSHLVDVASGAGNPQSFLAAHLDFTAPVADLGKSGFQLVGARLDYLRHREVAALAYRHDAHLVSLFIFPETEKHLGSAEHAERGFTCMTWKQGALRYVEVSDLDQGAMDAMKQDLDRGL